MKRIGNGFGFKMVQAVLYTLSALALIIAGAFFAVRSTDFLGAVFGGATTSGRYVEGYYQDGVYYESDYYTNYPYLCYDYGTITLEITRYDDINENVKTVYDFEQNNRSENKLIFSNGTQIIEVSYSDVDDDSMEMYRIFMLIFFSIGGTMAVVAFVHMIATFKGRKSKGANVLGIVVNFPFALGAFGLCGLVGCIKGRMYLQFKEAGYATGDPVQPAPARSVTAQSVHAEAVTQSAKQEHIGGVETKNNQPKTEQPAEKRQIKKSDFKLDLYDSSIDEKTWKQFKKTASQEELSVIAIGAKYRVAHSRIKNIIYAIGIVLSIALFWPTGGWSLIGYPVFAFLATKSIRYEDTLNQAYRKLDKENKAFVNSCFNCGIGWTILDILIKIGIFWLTIPYQAILLFIGLFAPNFVISKNGILVSIPNGYDVGDLGAIGAYYSSFSLLDEMEETFANQSKTELPAQSSSPTNDYYKKDEYTYTDSHGYLQTVYSDDGKNFYDAGGHYVGSSEDYGGIFKKED